MTSNRPHHQRAAADQRVGQAAMDTFTVRLPRWPVVLRLAKRNPLVRTTDRIEALVLVLAVVVSLLAIPIAAAVGTAVYDARHEYSAVQAHTGHAVTATVTEVPASQQLLRTATTAVTARWTAGGAEHVDVVNAQSTAKPGDSIKIWVDDNGMPFSAAVPTSRAAVEAVLGALVIWICATAIAVTALIFTRAVCDRVRFTGWQHDLDNLADNSGGHHPDRQSDR